MAINFTLCLIESDAGLYVCSLKWDQDTVGVTVRNVFNVVAEAAFMESPLKVTHTEKSAVAKM